TVWNALRLAVADAELDPRLALEVVSAAVPAEPVDAIVRTVAGWALRTLAGQCLPDAELDAATDRIADATAAALAAAAPGSGRQLAAARGWLAATRDTARLRGWLAGTVLPTGLDLDVELRWAAIERLAALGALRADELDAQVASDATDQGRLRAVTCRALTPDPASKQRAWHTMMSEPDCVNSELYAIAAGFWHPRQRELTTPFVARFFEQAPSMATLRSGWLVSKLASAAYPWTAVRPETAADTETLLAQRDLDPNVRRAVIDAGDDLRRALASRARFQAG
ncbi:MAG: ERAP1-like C-terminal domain-containing protein, partial [Actinomycetia bacterium]|nr:ERAP1-like C-terminal domain-containing protein [Actinomycetes bacterium]